MPLHTKTKFQETWLNESDANGQLIGSWCKRYANDEHRAMCMLCNKVFSIENSGIDQVKQHAKGKRHTEIARITSSSKQSRFLLQGQGNNSGEVKLQIHDHNVTKAEILWSMHCANNDYSFHSSDNCSDLFQAMFPDSKIAKDFKMGRTKQAYLTSDGLAPVFLANLVKEVNESKSPFTVHYDETTTEQLKKQLDLHIRYWSNANEKVCTHFYKSITFGHAKGEDICDAIINNLEMDNFSLKYLLSLGSDGPNVNKKVFRLISSKLKELNLPGLVDIGTCNLHVVHNAFHKALLAFGSEIEELIVDLHFFFKQSSARREDLENLQKQMKVPILLPVKHVPSRWVTLGPALARLIEQWQVYVAYFKKLSLEKNQPTCAQFKRICRKILVLENGKETLVICQFLIHVLPIFQDFLILFQSEAPKIHLLYDHFTKTVQSLMLKFVKLETIRAQECLGDVDFKVRANHLDDCELVIGELTRKTLKQVKNQEPRLLLQMRKFLVDATEYLLSKLPFNNSLLKDFRCLNPENLNEFSTGVEIHRIARKMKQHLDGMHDVAGCVDEWKAMQLLNDQEPLFSSGDRIDTYWATKLDKGSRKFPLISKLIKAALVLPHGNATVERGFSYNAQIVNDQRNNLDVKTISSLRLLKDVVKSQGGGKAQDVPLSKELISAAQSAHRSYLLRLEEQKRKEAEEEEKSKKEAEAAKAKKEFEEKQKTDALSLKEKEDSLNQKEIEIMKDVKVSQKVNEEGMKMLTSAIKRKNMEKVAAAEMMISAAEKKSTEAHKKLVDIRKQQNNIEIKKRKLLDCLVGLSKK